MDLFAFYIFAAIAVIASLGVIGQGNPMHSIMLLIGSFGALAGLYILLDAPFTAVTQIIVYAGAIMVLFLFVVMLLNAPREDVASPYGPAYVTLSSGPARSSGWTRRSCSVSSCGALSSITTKRNSTMIAPA